MKAVSDRIPRSSSTADLSEQLMNSLKTVDELKSRMDEERTEWKTERQSLVKQVEEVCSNIQVVSCIEESPCY